LNMYLDDEARKIEEQEKKKPQVKERPAFAILSIVLGLIGFWFFMFGPQLGMGVCAVAIVLGYLGRGVTTPSRGNVGHYGIGIGLVGFLINFFMNR